MTRRKIILFNGKDNADLQIVKMSICYQAEQKEQMCNNDLMELQPFYMPSGHHYARLPFSKLKFNMCVVF